MSGKLGLRSPFLIAFIGSVGVGSASAALVSSKRINATSAVRSQVVVPPSVPEERFFRIDCLESTASSAGQARESVKGIGKIRLTSNPSVSYPYLFDRSWRVVEARFHVYSRAEGGRDLVFYDVNLRDFKVAAHGYYQQFWGRATDGNELRVSSESGYGAPDDSFDFGLGTAAHPQQNCSFEML